MGLGPGSGFEYALASRGLTDAVTAVAIGDAVLGGLIAKRLHFASAPFPGPPEPITGDRVILVGRTVPSVIWVRHYLGVKLWQITGVLAHVPHPNLAVWVVAAAMVRVRLARCSCGRRSMVRDS